MIKIIFFSIKIPLLPCKALEDRRRPSPLVVHPWSCDGGGGGPLGGLQVYRSQLTINTWLASSHTFRRGLGVRDLLVGGQ